MFSRRSNIEDLQEPANGAGDLDNFPNLIPDTSPDFAKLKTYLLYLIIIATFSFAIAAYIKQSDNTPKNSEISQLEQISNNIFMGDAWDDKQINLFLYHWGNLSKQQQRSIQNIPWFQQLSVAIVRRIAQSEKNVDSNAFEHKSNIDLLRTLAIVIDARHVRSVVAMRPGTTRPDPHSNQPRKKHSQPTKLESGANEQKASKSHDRSQTAKVSSNRPAAQKHRTTHDDHAPQSLTAHAKRPSAKGSKHTEKTDRHSPSATVAMNTTKQALKHKSHTRKQSFKKLRFKHSVSPTPAELAKVVNQYIDAYEQGDVRKIMSMLSLNARTNNANNAKEIEENLKKVFAGTSDRQLFIRNVKWKYQKNIAKGVGDIQTLNVPRDNSGVVSTKGMIQIIAKKINNTILVTHIYTTKHPQ